jgi:Ca-activated chloride channel family protein
VFTVDVSGSMAGFPLDTAKKLLREVVGGLRPQTSSTCC